MLNKLNKLTIISAPIKKNKEWYVFAKCDCGSIKEFRLRYIKTGHSKSCGCYVKTHGLSNHPLFKVWQSMKERCYNVNHLNYDKYGGRGIAICEEWLHDAAIFITWALANGWVKGLEIDRKDNDLGYNPDNCRAVTPLVNMRNKRSILIVTYKGESKPLVEWADNLPIPIYTLRERLKRGWSVERAFTQPSQIKKTA